MKGKIKNWKKGKKKLGIKKNRKINDGKTHTPALVGRIVDRAAFIVSPSDYMDIPKKKQITWTTHD